jgi:RNase P subunit RPR2
MKKISKNETKEQVDEFFNKIKNKSPEEIKKMKKIAMNKNIKLKDQRKKFCEKCLTPYSGKEKIRIKKGIKTITCEKCGKINRWKVKYLSSEN